MLQPRPSSRKFDLMTCIKMRDLASNPPTLIRAAYCIQLLTRLAINTRKMEFWDLISSMQYVLLIIQLKKAHRIKLAHVSTRITSIIPDERVFVRSHYIQLPGDEPGTHIESTEELSYYNYTVGGMGKVSSSLRRRVCSTETVETCGVCNFFFLSSFTLYSVWLI